MRNHSFTPSEVRKVNAFVEVYDELLKFDAHTAVTENISPDFYDAEAIDIDLVLRITATGQQLHWHQWYYYDTGAITWSEFATNVLTDGSRPSVAPGSQGRIFFQNELDDAIYYIDDDYQDGDEVLFRDTLPNGPLALAAVSESVCYQMEIVEGDNDYNTARIQRVTSGGEEMWHGRIYGKGLNFNIFDAVVLNDGTEYIYFSDDGGNRTLYITYKDGKWSNTQYVFPMDVVDDTSQFRGEFASDVGNNLFLTGSLVRENGTKMDIYTLGPKRFTLGREMYIRNSDADNPYVGKFHLMQEEENEIWYIGPNFFYKDDACAFTGHPGGDNRYNDEIYQIHGFSLQSPINASAQVSQISLPYDAPDIGPNNYLHLYIDIDETQYSLGIFSVDDATRTQTERGKKYLVSGRGLGIKAIQQWQSDSSFDYWSQAWQSDPPTDLAKYIRSKGDWEEQNGGLEFTDLNEDGFLTFTAKATRNAVIRGKFTHKPGTVGTRDVFALWGVAANFYRESRYDAAKRLDIEVDDVRSDDYGTSALIAAYGIIANNDTEYGIGLYEMENDELTLLEVETMIGDELDEDADHEIMMRFDEGQAKVSILRDGETDWEDILEYTYEDPERVPWFKTFYAGEGEDDILDYNGRGALYYKNVTPGGTSLFFTSSSRFIPIDQFPAIPGNPSDLTVLADDEQIRIIPELASITPGQQVGPLSATVNGPVYHENATIGGNTQKFADGPNPNVLRQSLSGIPDSEFTISGISLYIKRTGSPRDLVVSIREEVQVAMQPIGPSIGLTEMSANSIPDDDFGWVTITFARPFTVSDEDFLVVYQKNPSNESSSNYYEMKYGAGSGGQKFNDNNDNWSNLGGELNYKLHGIVESYVEGLSPMYVHVTDGPDNGGDLDYFDGLYLVINDGKGKGVIQYINAYHYTADIQTFVVDNHFSYDESSEVWVSPCLIVTFDIINEGTVGVPRQNGRGFNGTNATSHASGTKVSVYHEPMATAIHGEFASGDVDMSLADSFEEIARKAGVPTVTHKNLHDGALSLTSWNVPASLNPTRLGFMVDIEPSNWTNEVGVLCRYDEDEETGFIVALNSNWISVYDWNGSQNLIERYPVFRSPTGRVRFSHWENRVSLWEDDTLIGVASIEGLDSYVGNTASIVSETTQSVGVYWESADIRIDNFIADMGFQGAQVISRVIGEKKFFFRDKMDGSIELFAERDTLPDISTYISTAESASDDEVVSRVRVEGGEVAERISDYMMREYGNVFRLINATEVNSLDDAIYYGDQVLSDRIERFQQKTYVGPIDPRIEPGDIIPMPDGDRIVVQSAIVFSVADGSVTAAQTLMTTSTEDEVTS